MIRPGGVVVSGVDRAFDTWLVEDSRTAVGGSQRAAVRLQWLDVAEAALDDGANGVGQSATALFNAADRLASDPSSTANRNAFLQAVGDVANAFRQTATRLESGAAGVAAAGQGTVDQLNTDLAALQSVNLGLGRARPGSTNQATLMDERDRLIDSISTAVPVLVELDANQRATLRLGNAGGPPLLDGATLGQFGQTLLADGQLSFTLTTAGGVIAPGSGSLSGLTDAAAKIAGLRGSLDTLAGQFANDLNAAHRNGTDANGDAGGGLLSFSGSAASLAALALAPGQVAAAASGSDNGNMLGLASLRGANGVEAGWNNMIAIHGQTVAGARAEEAAAATRRDGAFAARNEVSGVDLDREAAELLRYQQAYEGAARVIQVARETFQSILNPV
jgi:flagellar hook-associated protein 1